MKEQKTQPTLHPILSFALFGVLFVVFVVLAGIVVFGLQPNLNGIGGIMLGLMCATPLAFFLFIRFRAEGKSKWYKTYILPALIFPLLIVLFLGWTVFEQRPTNIFMVFVADPVPDRVSNIQARDISAGFDQEIVVAFDATPKAIDEITAINGLELDDDPYNFDRNDIPFEHFSDVNEDQDWLFYTKYDRENINWWFFWINADKTQAFFRFVDG